VAKLGLNYPDKIEPGQDLGVPLPPWPQRRTATAVSSRHKLRYDTIR